LTGPFSATYWSMGFWACANLLVLTFSEAS